jgi:hypothetical protein
MSGRWLLDGNGQAFKPQWTVAHEH